MSYVKGEAPGQSSLFPVSFDELIPTDHLVRVIEAYVARLDMATLGFAKAVTKTTGRPMIRPTCSNFISTAICTAFAPLAGWKPNASAMSR